MNSISRLIVFGCIAGLFAWVMGDAMFGSGVFCFRDAAHYYYPLFQFTAQQWAAGRAPLWNPYENLGQPLAADPTASVFYPGKLIFALPLALPLSFAWAYKLYIMGHLLLAAGAAYRLARHWKAGVTAAALCALSYAFSGNVLFQHCNVVFLVGAAWLPLGLIAADRMLVEKRVRWAVAFGAVLAMMVLGGDPQMAYNAGLMAALYALWLWWHDSPLSLWERVRLRAKRGVFSTPNKPHPEKDRKTDGPHPNPLPEGEGSPGSRLLLLALAAATGLVLSAVQVLPSLEFAGHSGRTVNRSADGLLCRFDPESHSRHVYHFSVGPWRLAEYVWPNVGGRQFPIHRRWLEVIPAEGRLWTPSLYMGILPLVLALFAMRFRRQKGGQDPLSSKKVPEVFFSWLVLLAVLASFGWYGFGWLLREIRVDAGVGAPFGGLYWLMTWLLPGYAHFRYPAKLLVVAALGLSVLSARGWDRAFAGPSDRLRRCLLWLGGLSACAAIAAWAIRPFFGAWLAGVKPDVLFGPFDCQGAADDLLWAFGQTAVLCGAFWWLLRKRGQDSFSWPMVALLLVAADLALANRWMVVCAPASRWERESKLASVLEGDARQPYRVFRHSIWMPPAWKKTSSRSRPADAVDWDRNSLWPKYNLAYRIPLAEVHGAMALGDYRQFTSTWTKPLLDMVGVKYLVLPPDENKILDEIREDGERIDVDVQHVSLWHNPDHYPRTWIAHQHGAAFSRPLKKTDIGQLCATASQKQCFSPRNTAGTASTKQWHTFFQGPFCGGRTHPLPGESCRVVHYDPLRVEIETELVKPGLVVLCDQFYPGWKLEVDGVPTPIIRTNRVMRGARLDSGRHRLVYHYRPASFTCGAIISGLGWLALAAVSVVTVAFALRATRRCASATSASPGSRSCAAAPSG